jgi:hypothetical protein
VAPVQYRRSGTTGGRTSGAEMHEAIRSNSRAGVREMRANL